MGRPQLYPRLVSEPPNNPLTNDQLSPCRRKHRQRCRPPTNLSRVTLTRHVAHARRRNLGIGQGIVAKALTAEFRAGDVVAVGRAVRDARRARDLAHAYASEEDSRCAERARVEVVGVAPRVRPVRGEDDGHWGLGRGGAWAGGGGGGGGGGRGGGRGGCGDDGCRLGAGDAGGASGLLGRAGNGGRDGGDV